jgi:hypothetical protein
MTRSSPSTKSVRTGTRARYLAAINELADAIAEMPVDELINGEPSLGDNTSCGWLIHVNMIKIDLGITLEKRHRKFVAQLDQALDAAFEQYRAKRRSAGARKAAATRAARRAAS